jgi:hypothetical protein
MSEPSPVPEHRSRMTRVILRVALIATALFAAALVRVACREDATGSAGPSDPGVDVPPR